MATIQHVLEVDENDWPTRHFAAPLRDQIQSLLAAVERLRELELSDSQFAEWEESLDRGWLESRRSMAMERIGDDSYEWAALKSSRDDAAKMLGVLAWKTQADGGRPTLRALASDADRKRRAEQISTFARRLRTACEFWLPRIVQFERDLIGDVEPTTRQADREFQVVPSECTFDANGVEITRPAFEVVGELAEASIVVRPKIDRLTCLPVFERSPEAPSATEEDGADQAKPNSGGPIEPRGFVWTNPKGETRKTFSLSAADSRALVFAWKRDDFSTEEFVQAAKDDDNVDSTPGQVKGLIQRINEALLSVGCGRALSKVRGDDRIEWSDPR